MNIKKTEKHNCEYRFGISTINNTALIKSFYPEDLPEEWRSGYYSNEFELLLIHLSELNLSSVSEQENDLCAEIIQQLTVLTEDVEDSAFCVFDCSTLSQSVQQLLLQSRIFTAGKCHFASLDKVNDKQQIHQSIQLEWSSLVTDSARREENSEPDLFCSVKSEVKITPSELKYLIECIQDYAVLKKAASISVVFSSDYALENCRNAMILESMM